MYILSQVNKETIWGSRELIAYGADPALDKVGSLYTLAANEEFDQLVCQMPGETDAAARRELVDQAMQIMYDMANIVPLYDTTYN